MTITGGNNNMATKKTAAKKAAPAAAKGKTSAKAAPARAGANKPDYNIDPAATQKMTDRKGLFFKFPVGNTSFRFLPQFNNKPSIFSKSVLHYTVKTDDMQRNIAPGCLEEHGEGQCYICAFVDWLKETEDPVLEKIAKDLTARPQLNVQAFVQDASKEWMGPVIVGVGSKLAQDMSSLLSMAKDNDLPYFCDPYMGETLVVNRVGTGMFDTKYTLMQTGKRGSLDTLILDWESRVIRDLWKKLDVKVLNVTEQKKALHRTYPDLPWQEIQKAIG